MRRPRGIGESGASLIAVLVLLMLIYQQRAAIFGVFRSIFGG